MSNDTTTKVLGFAGSLRDGSFNRALLDACVTRTSQSMELATFELDDIPMFNGDLEDGSDPGPIAELKDAIDTADGLLIVTPEYNHGVPAVTKNAVDWASRPPEQVLSQKPVAIAGASPSMTGTARAQSALRRSLASVDAYVMQKPGVLVASAHEKFEDGDLVDEGTGEFLEDFLEAFDNWIARFGRWLFDSPPLSHSLTYVLAIAPRFAVSRGKHCQWSQTLVAAKSRAWIFRLKPDSCVRTMNRPSVNVDFGTADREYL